MELNWLRQIKKFINYRKKLIVGCKWTERKTTGYSKEHFNTQTNIEKILVEKLINLQEQIKYKKGINKYKHCLFKW